MKDKCPKCGQIGIIVLEPPRKKHETKRPMRISRTVLHGLGVWKKSEYDSTRRIPTRYLRVHHYVTDKNGDYVRGKNGKPKSKFCYIGSFESAFKHFKKCKDTLHEYYTSQKSEETKKNEWLIWGIQDYEYMKDIYEKAKKINIKNLKPDDINLIYSVILDSQLWFIRNNHVFSKYA